MYASVLAGAMVDGIGLPEIGWTTGWVLTFFVGIQFLRGKILTASAHEEQVSILQASHAQAMAAKDAEIDRVEHDRQEWRSESRIKDAQLAEKDTQLNEQAKQISAMDALGRTLDSVLTAIRPGPGGAQ